MTIYNSTGKAICKECSFRRIHLSVRNCILAKSSSLMNRNIKVSQLVFKVVKGWVCAN